MRAPHHSYGGCTFSMKWSMVFLFLLVFFRFSDGGLISQSSIQSCDWGDSNEPTTNEGAGCREKLVVSMTLKSGQGEVESLYANINQVQTSENESGLGSLKKPFRIEIQKSQTITNYRVYYRGSVNALPQEHTRLFSRPSHCHDGWYEENLSCRKQPSLEGDEDFAWDSQGFCCKCSAYIREIQRSKGVCYGGIAEWFKHRGASGYTTYDENKNLTFGSSAHCMRMNDLWYDVYDIELPMMIYNISIRLLQYEGKVVDQDQGMEMTNWTTVSTFYLSPSKTMGRSADGKVVVELQGDLVGANSPLDFSAKKLLIPSLKVWQRNVRPIPPKAYSNGPSDWLLVDDHMVDMSGKQCNKVGVSYTGFKRQNSPCDKPEHSCFTNQPLQLWTYDDELRKVGKRGRYMVHNFGRIHPSTHVTNHSFILRFINTDLHNSFVTFRIDATDIVFVYNAAKGRIVDAYAAQFTAVKEVGQLTVEVENTGELQSEYSVILSDCLGRKSTPSKVVSISPGCIANVTFSLQSYKTKGENSLCKVQLFDKSFNLLGTSKVDVTVVGACFCFGECGCSCSSDKPGSHGNSTALPCPTPPPVIISKGNLALDIFFLVLESIGIHGIVGFFGGILMFLGCIKLLCGGIVFCRKTKAQEHYDNLIKKGVDPKSPALVKCTGECRGARAALARYKRKLERLKKIGKNPGLLDDWRNTSYECNCRDELADIRFAYVIKAVCFYYYCLFLPFIWLGKKIWWAVFKDTAAKKQAAQKAVLHSAKRKGKLEKYGIIDIEAELKNVENERNQLRGETSEKKLQDVMKDEQDTLINTELRSKTTTVAKTDPGENAETSGSLKISDGREDKNLSDKKSKPKKGNKWVKQDKQKSKQEGELLDKRRKEDRDKNPGQKSKVERVKGRDEKLGDIKADLGSWDDQHLPNKGKNKIEGSLKGEVSTCKINSDKPKLLEESQKSERPVCEDRMDKPMKQRAQQHLQTDKLSSQTKGKLPSGKPLRGRDLPVKAEKLTRSSRPDSTSPDRGSEGVDKSVGDHSKELQPNLGKESVKAQPNPNKELLIAHQSLCKLSLTTEQNHSKESLAAQQGLSTKSCMAQQSLSKVSLMSKVSDISVIDTANTDGRSQDIINRRESENSINHNSNSDLASPSGESHQDDGVDRAHSESMRPSLSHHSTSKPGLNDVDGSLQKHESHESKFTSNSEKALSSQLTTRNSPSNSDQSLSRNSVSSSSTSTNSNTHSTLSSESTKSSTDSTSSSSTSTRSKESSSTSSDSSKSRTNTTSRSGSSSSVSNSDFNQFNDSATNLVNFDFKSSSSPSNASKSNSISSFTTCFTSSQTSTTNPDESPSFNRDSTDSFASGTPPSQQSNTSLSENDYEQDSDIPAIISPSEQSSKSQESSEEESPPSDHSSVDSSSSTSTSIDSQSTSNTTSDKESSLSSKSSLSQSQSLSSLDS